MIRALFLLWFAWQSLTPEAVQHMQAGVAAEKQQQFDTAIAEFKQVTALAPNAADGFINLGQANLEAGNYGAAIPPLKRALQINPDVLPVHGLLGYALLAQGYAAEAIPHLAKVQDLGAQGIAEIQTGQLSDAVTHLQAAYAAHPNDTDLLYYLGRASGLLSKQSIDTLLAASPDNARAHQAMAENYFVLRRMPDAEKELQEALKLRPHLPKPTSNSARSTLDRSSGPKPKTNSVPKPNFNPAIPKPPTVLVTHFSSKAKRKKPARSSHAPTACCRTCRRPSIR